MEWFYANGGNRVGPINAKQFELLIRDAVVNDASLVWSNGMSEWQPWAQVAGSTAVCAASNGRYWLKDMVPYEGKYISAEWKGEYFQKLREGITPTGMMHFAGFWIRFVAKFIDGIVTGVVGMVINLGIAFLFFGAFKFQPDINDAQTFGRFMAYQGVTMAIGLVLGVLYQWFFLSRFSATPGKMALGLKVVRADGSPLTTGRIIGRYFSELLSGLILLIGYIMAGFDEEKRALHDRLCDTRVIKAK